MKRTITTMVLLAVLVTAAFSQTPYNPRFAHFSQRTDERTGLSISILVVRTNPRCKVENNCEWIVEWVAKKKCDRVEFDVLYTTPAVEHATAVVHADQQDLALRNPTFTVPLDQVIAIRVTTTRGANIVARTEFR
jgi:hypothetical protein